MFRKSSKPNHRRDQTDRSIYNNTSSLSSAAQRHSITYQFQENSVYPGSSDAKLHRDKIVRLQPAKSIENLDYHRESSNKTPRSASPTKQSSVQEIVRNFEPARTEDCTGIRTPTGVKKCPVPEQEDSRRKSPLAVQKESIRNSSPIKHSEEFSRRQHLPQQKKKSMLKWRYRSRDNVAEDRERSGNSEDATSTSEAESGESIPAADLHSLVCWTCLGS